MRSKKVRKKVGFGSLRGGGVGGGGGGGGGWWGVLVSGPWDIRVLLQWVG